MRVLGVRFSARVVEEHEGVCVRYLLGGEIYIEEK